MPKLVSELSGGELDYWVGMADGKDVAFVDGKCHLFTELVHWEYSPSSHWEEGGPIIDREKIALANHDDGVRRVAVIDDPISWNTRYHGFGETSLIAAMRAFVMSKFGGEVHDGL